MFPQAVKVLGVFLGRFGTIFRLRSKKAAPAAAITTMGELPSLRRARKAPRLARQSDVL